MMRLRGHQQRALSDHEFLDIFYTKLTVSNFKDRIKTKAGALRYYQLSGQVRVRGGQVWYQNVQLDELNPMMYHTWGWEVWNPLGPKPSLSPHFLYCQ